MSARSHARQGGSERAVEAFGEGVEPSSGNQPLIAPGSYDEDDEGYDEDDEAYYEDDEDDEAYYEDDEAYYEDAEAYGEPE